MFRFLCSSLKNELWNLSTLSTSSVTTYYHNRIFLNHLKNLLSKYEIQANLLSRGNNHDYTYVEDPE